MSQTLVLSGCPPDVSDTCIVRMSPRHGGGHLYCQDVPQMSQTLVLSGCLPDMGRTLVLSGCPPDVSDACIVRIPVNTHLHVSNNY